MQQIQKEVTPYESFSFVADSLGPIAVAKCIVVKGQKVGRFVTIHVHPTAYATGTSTSATVVSSSILVPAGFRPREVVKSSIILTNNTDATVYSQGYCTISTTGDIFFSAATSNVQTFAINNIVTLRTDATFTYEY